MGLIESLGLEPPKSMGGRGGAAKPVAPSAPAVPSAEAQKFTRHAKEVLAQVARLEAARSPDAARLKKAAVEAAKLGQASKSRHQATQALEEVAKEVTRLMAEAERAAKAPKAPRYTMRIGGRQLVEASADQACAELKKALDDLERKLQNGFEQHCDLLKIQREEPFAAWIASGLTAVRGGQQMPELEIWDGARDLVIEARRCLKQREVEAIAPLFPKIAAATKKGLSAIGKYNDDAIESAGQAIEIAKKTEEVSATVISKAAEKMGGKGAGIAAEAGAKALFEGAEQWSAVHIAKTRKEIDWGAVAKEGAASAAEGIVGLLLEGVLVEKLSGLFGGYLSKAKFPESELIAMGKAVGLTGPIPRDHLMTAVQKFARDFVVNKAKGLVTGIVGDLIKGKKESDPPKSLEEFAGDVAKKLASGKAIEMFADYVVEHAAEVAKAAVKA